MKNKDCKKTYDDIDAENTLIWVINKISSNECQKSWWKWVQWTNDCKQLANRLVIVASLWLASKC